MWQEQANINISFNKSFNTGHVFLKSDIRYQITGIGYTHIICSNESHLGKDIFISKEDFLKKYSEGVLHEN